MFRSSRIVVGALLLATLIGGIAKAAEKDNYNVGPDHVAIKGYDPVAYFDGGAPAVGDEKITAEFGGVIYRFASDAHKQTFLADPKHYCPQYGGWCATALAVGHGKVDVDPKSFKVTDGKLFLFYKGLLGDARKSWVKDEPGNIVKADQAWKKIAE
jgi:hypothetical protein